VGRTETILQSCIREPAQASALAELRQSISSSLEALNQRVEAVQNVRTASTQSHFTRPNDLDHQLAHINTKALQTIGDQQFQILTAIIPVLPMLQKVPLHIASTEANLKEVIWKSIVAPPIASTQPTSAGSTSGSVKRKPSRSAEQYSPSPSVTKRRRIQIGSGFTAQQQLPSPKSSHDTLLAQSGLPTTNQHRSIGDPLRSGSRSSNTPLPPNPGQRSSMQPPTPRIVPGTPSRMRSVALSDMSAQPTPSSLSHKKPRASDASAPPHFARPVPNAQLVTLVPPNRLDHPNDAFKAPNLFYTHTPLRTGSKQHDDWSSRPLAPAQSSSGFSAVRRRLARKPLSVLCLQRPFFPSHSDEGNASSQSPTMTMTRLSMIDVQQTTKCSRSLLFPSVPRSLFEFVLPCSCYILLRSILSDRGFHPQERVYRLLCITNKSGS